MKNNSYNLNLKVSTKIVGIFVFIAVVVFVVATVAIIFLENLETSYQDIIENKVEISQNVLEINSLILAQNNLVQHQIFNDTNQESTSFATNVERFEVLMDQAITLAEKDEELKEQVTGLQKIKSLFADYVSSANQLLADRSLEQKSTSENVYKLVDDMLLLSQQMMEPINNNVDAQVATSVRFLTFVINLIYVMATITITLTLGIGYFLYKGLSKNIKLVSEQTKLLAAGKFNTDSLQINAKDEVGELANSLNIMSESIREIIGEVNQTSQLIASSSEQLLVSTEETKQSSKHITISIQDVHEGAEVQKDSQIESIRSLTEMTQGMEKMLQAAIQVSDEAIQTSQEAEQGNELIQQVMNQMIMIKQSVEDTTNVIQRLYERSKEINNISTMITTISEQTNLLSLNAAIEAARAGEAGKGFAVVADEVRKLADESRHSAAQISVLIREIQQDTSQAVEVTKSGIYESTKGIDVVKSTGKGFQRIYESIDQVSSQVQEMKTISELAYTSISKVNDVAEQSIQLSDNVISHSRNVASASEQQYASMDEVAQVAASLAQLSENLSDQMKKFEV